MQTLTKSVAILFALLLCHSSLSAQQKLAMPSKLGIEKTYHINKKSVLKLEGKTNVNGFTCGCKETFQPQQLIAKPQSDGNLSFSSASLNLKIKSLDCSNKLINKDLQKALNAAEHPNITIELEKVEQDKCNRLTELKDWVILKALTNITLNGISKEYWISITAKKYAANQYRFIGAKTLNMSDFGVKPPRAMMGMIKVQDAITIHLDLDVSVE